MECGQVRGHVGAAGGRDQEEERKVQGKGEILRGQSLALAGVCGVGGGGCAAFQAVYVCCLPSSLPGPKSWPSLCLSRLFPSPWRPVTVG